MKSNRRPRKVRLGSREIVSKNLPFSVWSDLSHRSMTASWPVFVIGTTLLFVAINCAFAGIYILGAAPIANTNGTFLDYLYFSIETFTTVGYGYFYPRTHYGHVVASVELYVGVFTTAVITGLVFYRFSRARARIMFAKVVAITMHDGKPSLMIRLANERLNAIADTRARVWLSQTVTTLEGKTFRRFGELKLLREQSPLFQLSWTIIHVIDETSLLYGLDLDALIDQEATIMAMVEGHDESRGQTVRARKTYLTEDIRFNESYVDILEATDDDRTVLNYLRFHDTEPNEGSNALPRIVTHPVADSSA